ncbi:MAG TPA: hypothetical protein VHQ68_01730, partial [Propionibacteriaceae bacterium]|nr:hypothetical protein [Propionibacteriaceae bacterium]
SPTDQERREASGGRAAGPDPLGWPSLRDTASYLATECRGGWANQRGPGPLAPAGFNPET